jgi:hypothetical protein
MKRRDAVKTTGAITGHVLFPSVLLGFLQSCNSTKRGQYKPVFFTPDEFQWLKKTIDIIIPKTGSSSASESGTHEFLDQVFFHCFEQNQQQQIRIGIEQLVASLKKTDDPVKLIMQADQEAYNDNETYAYFRILKQYTLVGFFTSREGETEASNYVQVPGRYEGDIEATPETKNWGYTSLRYYL